MTANEYMLLLADARAAQLAVAGGKGASLARLTAADVPLPGGFVDAQAHAIPGARHVVLHGQGHDAHVKAPEQLARVIETHADLVLRLARN